MRKFQYIITITVIFLGISLSHSQNRDFTDNTNSEGLSSMQRAILNEDILRMEGLIKNGAGYHTNNKEPLINYAISNNKPKAIEFLLNKQAWVDITTVLTAMEASNYTLVRKFIDETNIISETIIPIRSSDEETDTFEVSSKNWQLTYTLKNEQGSSQSYTVKPISKSVPDVRKFIIKEIKAKKQKGELLNFSVSSIIITTNSIPTELNGDNLSVLAIMSVGQNSLEMLKYFVEKGASVKTKGLLHIMVLLPASKEMLLYLLDKGGDPFMTIPMPYYNNMNDYWAYSLFDSSSASQAFWKVWFNTSDYIYETSDRPFIFFDNDTLYQLGDSLTPYLVVLRIVDFFSSKRILEWEKKIQASKQNSSYNRKRIISEEKRVSYVKKNLPKWKEILDILKKYEE